MSEAKYTPGPWFYVEAADQGEFFGCGVSETADGPGFIWFDDAINPEKDIANVRLIAAAPDLLEALEELADLFDAMVSGEYRPDSFITRPARTAIAKAKGET